LAFLPEYTTAVLSFVFFNKIFVTYQKKEKRKIVGQLMLELYGTQSTLLCKDAFYVTKG